MKLAIAGKGGVGKTSLTAWLADYLSRTGKHVWLVDADTALSLGAALGLDADQTPSPLVLDEELIRERVGHDGFINLAPDVEDLPERLCVRVRGMKLLAMGTVAGAGGGCACAANALLKALLAHLVIERDQWVLVDLEAGVEHLGRGTVQSVDGLIVVSEPGLRSLQTAATIGQMAMTLGLGRQALVLNRAGDQTGLELPQLEGLPALAAVLPRLASLEARQYSSGSVLDLPEQELLDRLCGQVLAALGG